MDMDELQKQKKRGLVAWAIVALIIVIHLISFLPTPYVFYTTRDIVHKEYSDIGFDGNVPGIVFGASVTAFNTPSTILKDRLDVAAEIFHNGHINQIVLSGNDDTPYNEVSVMKEYLLEQYSFIEEDDLITDGYGYRTYDTCVRAKKVLEIDKAVLITSGYHLPRSLYLCNNLGVESVGINSTRSEYENKYGFYLREVYAIDKALIDLYFQTPEYSLEQYIEPDL